MSIANNTQADDFADNQDTDALTVELPDADDAGIGTDAGGAADAGAEELDEVVITIDGVAPDPEDIDDTGTETPTFRELRKHTREQARKIRELENKLKTPAAEPAEKPAAALGEKPTLADHDYDTDAYESALAKWFDDKRAADAAAAEAAKAKEAEAAAWTAKLNHYATRKAALRAADFEDAEAEVNETLTQTQRGLIVHVAADPAVVIYALGKNKGKAKELASITDPALFAAAIGALETKMTVTNRKAAPPPERQVQGTARAGAVDSTLERLMAEADKTGDRTKVVAYRKQLRDKQR